MKAEISEVLQVAAKAPSAHNTQPWDCSFDGDDLVVSRSPARTLEVGDPTGRQACLSIGMFLETLDIAAKVKGLEPSIVIPWTLPRELAVARVTFGRSPTRQVDEEARLLNRGIASRRTNRGSYEPTLQDQDWLARWSVREEATLRLISNQDEKAAVAHLVGESIRLALGLPTMRRELAHLTHWEGEPATYGMPIQALVGDVREAGSAPDWFLQTVDREEESQRFEERYVTSPVIVVISTHRDDPQAWISAGREGCRILLRAAVEGLSHCISAGPVEVPTLLPALREFVDGTLRPQLVFRLGRPLQSEFNVKTPRASVVVREPS